MKLKVLKVFHDKVTNEIRQIGDVIEVNDERGAEILQSPLKVAEEVIEGAEPNEPPAAGGNEPPTDGEDFEKLSVEELKAKAEEMGIDTTNLKKKKDFIKALKK